MTGWCGQQAGAEWDFAVVCPAGGNISNTCDASETCAHIHAPYLGLRADDAANSIWQQLRKGDGLRNIGKLVRSLKSAAGGSFGGLRMLERVKDSPRNSRLKDRRQREGEEARFSGDLLAWLGMGAAGWLVTGWLTCWNVESRSASTRIAARPTRPRDPVAPGRCRGRLKSRLAKDHGRVRRQSTIRRWPQSHQRLESISRHCGSVAALSPSTMTVSTFDTGFQTYLFRLPSISTNSRQRMRILFRHTYCPYPGWKQSLAHGRGSKLAFIA